MSRTHTNGTETAAHAVEGPIEILLIGSNETVSVTASQLESRHERFRVTAAVVTPDGTVGEVLSGAPDCIVCCSTLADTTRDAVVAAIAEGAVPDCPVFVVTDTPESHCSAPESEVVTDYVHPRRLEDDPTLTHRLLTAVESHRRRRQLERERQEKEAVLTMLRTASSRDGVGGSFCEFLVSDREYHSVWIGTAVDTDTLTGQWACGATDYTDAVLEPTPPSQTDEPAIAAFERGEPRVVSKINATKGNWQATAAEHGIEAAIGVPIRYHDTVLGALSVYETRQLDAAAVEFLAGLGETIGYALRSVAWKESLLSPTPVTLRITIADESVPVIEALQALPEGAQLTVLTAVPREETVVYVVQVTGPSPEEFLTAHPLFAAEATVLTDEPLRVEITLDRPTPTTIIADHGGELINCSVTQESTEATIAVRDEDHIETLVDAIEHKYARTRICAVRSEDAQPSVSRDDLLESLTERQQQITKFAYFNGYFQRPRERNMTELAETLDLSRQTVAQHLRTGERKLFRELFDPESPADRS